MGNGQGMTEQLTDVGLGDQGMVAVRVSQKNFRISV